MRRKTGTCLFTSRKTFKSYRETMNGNQTTKKGREGGIEVKGQNRGREEESQVFKPSLYSLCPDHIQSKLDWWLRFSLRIHLSFSSWSIRSFRLFFHERNKETNTRTFMHVRQLIWIRVSKRESERERKRIPSSLECDKSSKGRETIFYSRLITLHFLSPFSSCNGITPALNVGKIYSEGKVKLNKTDWPLSLQILPKLFFVVTLLVFNQFSHSM